MHINCDTCTMRDLACGDCVVTHLLALPPLSAPARIVAREERALAVLQGAGLVPPLRMQRDPHEATG